MSRSFAETAIVSLTSSARLHSWIVRLCVPDYTPSHAARVLSFFPDPSPPRILSKQLTSHLNVRLRDLAYCPFLDTTDYLSYWLGDILWTMSLDALLNLMRLHGMVYDNLSKTDARLAVVRHLSSAACSLYARRSVSSIPVACLDFIILYVLRR